MAIPRPTAAVGFSFTIISPPGPPMEGEIKGSLDIIRPTKK